MKRTTPKYIIRQGTKSKELSSVADKGAMKYQKEARRISSKKQSGRNKWKRKGDDLLG